MSLDQSRQGNAWCVGGFLHYEDLQDTRVNVEVHALTDTHVELYVDHDDKASAIILTLDRPAAEKLADALLMRLGIVR